MHTIDMDLVEMTLDVMKYTIDRISNITPELGAPKKEEELLRIVGETITPNGIGGENAFKLFKDVLVKACVPIDHPRHLAFVPAAPTRAAIMFDLVTSASSIHGAYWMEGAGGIFCENQAMKWLVSLTGLPETAFGVFTSGGTAANLSAMVAAREEWRRRSSDNVSVRGLLLTSDGAHSSVQAMAKVIDADVVMIDNHDERITGAELRRAIEELEEKDRKRLFAVVATGGTTNAGIIDELDSIASVCEQENVWFHVDCAYGGGALAANSVRHLFNGIEKADSITIDPHKWLFSPYDCGAVIYKDLKHAKNAHSQKGAYLEIFKDEGAQGFNPADYQIQLTRRVRGMPLWFSLAMHGTDKYKQAIERGIELAKIAENKINESEHVEVVRPSSLSVVLFRRKDWTPDQYKDWTYKNHNSGFALVTPTTWKKETVARFCFINPDTTEDDIDKIIASMK
ncbi:MAG: aspartate aminotransferase family protein [Zunongwangia sp.]|uniref:Aspartate aminotransferase family protein n=1 Tax=Zunongwangia profunda TaxID=398743 RepID=A0A3D5IXP6_9FLAO|nr:aminotransferase class V-fold PLP-dependent enzyme [Zunongwangia profunda]MAG87931.1 aspartate aminotransferase family protein [Flavobacteriaceae bacterium]MAO35917.1 aspartate aminotransferase family protein [Zunongwangia sp.]MAS69525.1 aspartate aminotransferase family protein [Zunongwangia sp.]MCC4229422.1 aminotransferase class V-fold PLP-dependent enzyme [Zunongwangia profunda]HAJ82185.1 aspartate aminotransferase family protein [Zunongwangia profunda]